MHLAFLALLVAASSPAIAISAPPAAASGQFVTQAESDAWPIFLADGYLAVLRQTEAGVVVETTANLGAGDPPFVLESGDVVVAFHGAAAPALGRIRELWESAAVGESISLVVERQGATLTFAVVRVDAQPMMMPSSGGDADLSAAAPQGWVQENPDEAAVADADARAAGGFVSDSSEATAIDADPAAAVDAYLREQFTSDAPGVTVAVVHHGVLAHTAARGAASVEHQRPLTPTSAMPLASVTKIFTGYAIAALSAEGHFGVETTLPELLPETAAFAASVTIDDLLRHTSGVKDYTGLFGLAGWTYGDDLTQPQLMTLVSRQRELAIEPGSAWRYSNTNFALLAEIVTRASGQPYEAWLAEHLFQPLGMTRTAFDASALDASTRVDSYRLEDGRHVRAIADRGLNGAGGLISSAEDLARWAVDLLDPRVGDPRAYAAMQIGRRLPDGTNTFAGLGEGAYRGRRTLGHSGGSPWTATVVSVYPDHDFAVVVLANAGDVNVGDVARAITDIYLGVDSEDGETEALSGLPRGAFMITRGPYERPAESLGVEDDTSRYAAYVGRYESADDARTLFIERDGDLLVLKLEVDMVGAPLFPLPNGRYLWPPARWEIAFVDDGGDAIVQLVQHVTENSIRPAAPYTRLYERTQIEPFSDAKLRSFAGTYFSDELLVAYEVRFVDGGLVLEHPRLGTLPMRHLSGGAFALPNRDVSRLRFEHVASPDDLTPPDAVEAEAFAWGATARFRRLPPAASR